MLSKIKGTFIISLLLLSFVACNYVTAAPRESQTPMDNLMNYITVNGDCNELEASMILNIMVNHSVNYDGLQMYLKYRMGNYSDIQEEAHSVRGQDYIAFWDNFIKSWSNKNITEKAKELQIISPSTDKTNQILNNMDASESTLVLSKIQPILDKIQNLTETLNDDNFYQYDVKETGRIKNELKNVEYELNNAVETAHIEYSLMDHNIEDYSVFNYQSDALSIYNDQNFSSSVKEAKLTNLLKNYTKNLDGVKNTVNTTRDVGNKIYTKGVWMAGAAAIATALGGSLIAAGVVVFGMTMALAAPIAGILISIGILLVLCGVVLFAIGPIFVVVGNRIMDSSWVIHEQIPPMEATHNLASSFINDLIQELKLS